MASPGVATCSTAEWTLNSRGQSPCFIASTIAQACAGDENFALPQLPEGGGHHYDGPPATPGSATECRCNTAFYSLQSACALCQHTENNFLRWSDYATNCSATYEGLPVAISSSVLIPAYAYLNVVINDTFNVALAQSPAFRNLDFTATSVGTMSLATETPHLSTESEDATHTSSHDDESDSSSPTHPATDHSDSEQPTSADTKTRAIVGGVVGAVCGLILIGGLIVYCLRRRRKRRILSTPLQAVDGVSNTTLPSHVTSQDGSDRSTDEKGTAHPPFNAQTHQLDGSDFGAEKASP